jgi:mRNA interferase MazF
MQRGEVWSAATAGGDRPVLVLTRGPVAARIGAVVVAALRPTLRGLVSGLALTEADGVPTACVVNFDDLHAVPRDRFRRRVARLSATRTAEACRALQAYRPPNPCELPQVLDVGVGASSSPTSTTSASTSTTRRGPRRHLLVVDDQDLARRCRRQAVYRCSMLSPWRRRRVSST